MKKMLVTAAEVKRCYQDGKQAMEVPPGTIVTPAARDAAKEYGVQIITAGAAQRPVQNAFGAVQQPGGPVLDPDLMARIVNEVLSRLGSITSLAPAVIKETGPDGTVVARGDSSAMMAAAAGVRRCRLLDFAEAGGLAVMSVELDRQARWQPDKAAVVFAIAGTGMIGGAGRDIAIRAGDAAHVPPSVAVTTNGGLRLLAVYQE